MKYRGNFWPTISYAGVISALLTASICCGLQVLYKWGFLGIGKIILGVPERKKCWETLGYELINNN